MRKLSKLKKVDYRNFWRKDWFCCCCYTIFCSRDLSIRLLTRFNFWLSLDWREEISTAKNLREVVSLPKMEINLLTSEQYTLCQQVIYIHVSTSLYSSSLLVARLALTGKSEGGTDSGRERTPEGEGCHTRNSQNPPLPLWSELHTKLSEQKWRSSWCQVHLRHFKFYFVCIECFVYLFVSFKLC